MYPAIKPARPMIKNGSEKSPSLSHSTNPTKIGPTITPNCQPASKRANPAVRSSGVVISAILPPAAGRTALPKSPFINLVNINKGSTR